MNVPSETPYLMKFMLEQHLNNPAKGQQLMKEIKSEGEVKVL